MSDRASRDSWKTEPLADPQPIPAPDRVWTDEEMDSIRRGYVPHMMEEKWFMFIEEQRDANDPRTNWVLTVPTVPKEMFFPRVIKNPESS